MKTTRKHSLFGLKNESKKIDEKTGQITIEGKIDFNDPSNFELLNMLHTDKEEEAIKLLKSKGYKIYKPIFQEL